MQSSHKYLDRTNSDHSPNKKEGEEVYQMTRLTVSNQPRKKKSSKVNRKLSHQGPHLNETLRLAAKGHVVSHRLNVDGDSLAHALLLQEEQNKKKGIFFLCC